MVTRRFPETKSLLPSKAKQVVTEYLLGEFEKAPRDCYNNPIFDYAEVLGIPCEDPYLRGVLSGCYGEAKKAFEAKHPFHWSNELQCSYRD
jgi:hypothetical protein